MIKKIISLIVFVAATLCTGQSSYSLVYEKQFHQNIAAENLHAALCIYDFLDSYFKPKANVFTQSNYGKIVNSIFRLSNCFKESNQGSIFNEFFASSLIVDAINGIIVISKPYL